MPVIEVQMWPGRTREQKAALSAEITDAFQRIAGSQPDHIHIIFRDIEKSDWAIAGKLADET